MTVWLYRNVWFWENGNVAEGPEGRGTVCTVRTVRCTWHHPVPPLLWYHISPTSGYVTYSLGPRLDRYWPLSPLEMLSPSHHWLFHVKLAQIPFFLQHIYSGTDCSLAAWHIPPNDRCWCNEMISVVHFTCHCFVGKCCHYQTDITRTEWTDAGNKMWG